MSLLEGPDGAEVQYGCDDDLPEENRPKPKRRFNSSVSRLTHLTTSEPPGGTTGARWRQRQTRAPQIKGASQTDGVNKTTEPLRPTM